MTFQNFLNTHNLGVTSQKNGNLLALSLRSISCVVVLVFIFVLRGAGSRRDEKPRTTSLLNFAVSLWQILSSDLVALPAITTNMRWPMFS